MALSVITGEQLQSTPNPANRRFSSGSSASSSTSSMSSTANAHAQAQDLRLGTPPQPLLSSSASNTVNSRRRKLPDDSLVSGDCSEDFVVQDGKIVCKFCRVQLDSPISIKEHLQNKQHLVQKQLHLMNLQLSNSMNPLTAVDIIMKQHATKSASTSSSSGSEEPGSADQLSGALKSAACVIDAEIGDIDERIGQFQAQIEELRAKRAKLTSHKAEITGSLSGVRLVSAAPSALSILGNLNQNAALMANIGRPPHPGADILQQFQRNFNATNMASALISALSNNTSLNSNNFLLPQFAQLTEAGKPLQSLVSSVVDASQAEESLPETPNHSEKTTPAQQASSRRKTLKPTRKIVSESGEFNEASCSTPTDLSMSSNGELNRVPSVAANDDSPLSLVKFEQRESSAHSPSFEDNKLVIDEVDRPVTPEIQQYNPALADKRFRGKAVQYCLLKRFNDIEVYNTWIRLQKVTRDKRTDTETGIKDFFRCPYARKIGWQPCPFRMYALFRPETPGQVTVFRSEVDHYHAQLPAETSSDSNVLSNYNHSNNGAIFSGAHQPGDDAHLTSYGSSICIEPSDQN